MSPLFGENKRHKKVWRHTGKWNGAAVLLRLLLMLLLLYIWTSHKKKKKKCPEYSGSREDETDCQICEPVPVLSFGVDNAEEVYAKVIFVLISPANWAVLPRVLLLDDENQTVRPPSSCVSTATGKRWRPLNSLCVRWPFCSPSEDGGGR